MATDKWYLNELVADVPDDELSAALEDEDWVEGEGEDDSSPDSDPEDEESDYADSCVSDGALSDIDSESYPQTPPGSPGSEEPN